MELEVQVTKRTYMGLFMVTLATLMYEIILTRIFSVTMWYHFAFMAISVAMFGMTVGAILVYLFPRYFTPERARYHLALSSLLFTLSIVLSFLTHLSVPFYSLRGPNLVEMFSIVSLYSLVLSLVAISIPFVLSGVCVCLALTKFPRQVSKMYAADLAGAAMGCILVIYLLRVVDGPTAVFGIAFLASVAALLFATDIGYAKLTRIALVSGFLLASFTVGHAMLAHTQRSFLRPLWVKGRFEPRGLYEKWNSFSRILVKGNPSKATAPFGWGLSPLYPAGRKVRQLSLDIDASAGTVLTAFNGDLSGLEHLKYDVTNIVHYIRPDSRVLTVGVGGGRDILSALVFEQESVTGVEINSNIIEAVNQRFGDFTGHLDRDPRVTFVHDEARSYIARQREAFDIIQVSLIDTWAATAAGAFVLTENALYTAEAWELFLRRLEPRGVLTFSRWYFRSRPGEVYRLTSLASASLMALGVKNPRDHIIIVRCMRGEGDDSPNGVGTILVSKEPFTDEDLDTIDRVVGDMRFDMVLSPRFSLDSTFATLASGKDLDKFTAEFPINIVAPTDDSPFFFQMLRLRDLFRRELWDQGPMSTNMRAVSVLGVILIVMVGLTCLCVIVPLLLTTKREVLRGTLPLFVFFASIGFGFMLVEISQMQRLIVFLGHPTYGLSVILFSLLVSGGAGSFLTQRIGEPGSRGRASFWLFLLPCVLVVFGVLTPYLVRMFQESSTPLRILVATGILFPLGLFMGMAFPLGMKLASTLSASLTPWLWGINGTTSVCASVVGVVIALSSSISASFWTGFLCYVVAFLAFVWARRDPVSRPAG